MSFRLNRPFIMHSLYKVIAYRGALIGLSACFASEATKWIPTKFNFEGINSSLVKLSTVPPRIQYGFRITSRGLGARNKVRESGRDWEGVGTW